MITGFRIEGAAEMERLLRALGPRVAARAGDAALRAAARPIVEDARRRVPVRTGALKRAITVAATRPRREDQRVVLIGIKPPVSRRAHLTEFGTRFQPARPFLRPALDSRHAEALDGLGRALGEGIERAAEDLARP